MARQAYDGLSHIFIPAFSERARISSFVIPHSLSGEITQSSLSARIPGRSAISSDAFVPSRITLYPSAAADGYSVILDGTNASDDIADRPGIRALNELCVISPLRECGITKDEIRALSLNAGIKIWDKPSYACLATRIPTGTAITADMLKNTERAEKELAAIGFSDFRIRYIDGAARIQVRDEQMEKLFKMRGEIIDRLKPYYKAILLDLGGRQ